MPPADLFSLFTRPKRHSVHQAQHHDVHGQNSMTETSHPEGRPLRHLLKCVAHLQDLQALLVAGNQDADVVVLRRAHRLVQRHLQQKMRWSAAYCQLYSTLETT